MSFASEGRGLSEQAQAAERRKLNVKPLTRLLPYIGRYRYRALAALVALTIAALTTLVVPVAVRRMIDFGFSAKAAELIDSYFSVMIAVVAVLAVSSALRYYLVITLGERIVADLRADVFAHLTKLSSSFFDTAKTGEMISRLTADTTQIKSAVGASVSIALRNLVLFFGGAAMMVVTSPRLSLFVLAAIPVIVLPLVGFGRAVRKKSRAAQDTLADASGYASELIGAVRTLQAFTNEALARRRFGAAVEGAYEAARGATQARSILTSIAIFLIFSSVVLVLWVGAQDVLAGDITPGRLSQFILYAVFAAGGLGELSQVWGEIAQASGAAERLFEILSVEPAIKAPAQPLALARPARGEVTFDNVRFAYPTRPDAYVLDGLTFKVKPGERLALVGPSGAGKSTIFHLILRFYDPQSGTVSFDGGEGRSRRGAPRDRFGAAGRRRLRRHRAREHPLRPARRHRRRNRESRASRARRRIHRPHAAGLRHASRRARHYSVRRPAPAHRHCPRDLARGAAAAARRGDLGARCRERNVGATGAHPADAAAHLDRHRASSRNSIVL